MRTSVRTVAAAAVAFMLATAGLSPAIAAPSGAGTVTVTVVAPGGTPIPGVSVIVAAVDADGVLGSPQDSGRTGATGVFTTAELPSGEYEVSAALGGHLDTESLERVTVDPNADAAVTVTLTKVQAIRGTVTANGEGVSDGHVEAYSGSYAFEAEIVDGAYVLFVKPGLAYTLLAVADYRSVPSTWLDTYYGDTVRAAESRKVRVSAEAPATADIAAYAELGALSGTVVRSDGTAVKNATVHAQANDRFGFGTVRTDSQGRYSITGLVAGTYTVDARDASYRAVAETVKKVKPGVTATARLVLKKLPKHSGKIVLTLSASRALVKSGGACAVVYKARSGSPTYTYPSCLNADGKSKTVSFRGLAAGKYKVALLGANLSKTVTVKKDKTVKVSMTRPTGKAISGKITNSAGKALANATVYVTDSNGTDLGGTATNRKGAYKIPGALTGTYTVHVQGIRPADGARTSKSTTLTSTKRTVNVRLKRGATVTGKIINRDGEPVSDVGVALYTPDGRVWSSGATNGRGVYTIAGVAPGTLTLKTYDNVEGGYFHASPKKITVKTGAKLTVATITLKR